MDTIPKLLLPQGFDPEAIVSPLKADAARWLVSTVLHKRAFRDVDARGFAILSATILQRVMGDGYAKIVRALIYAGVLLRSPYREGRSHGYRLADGYLAGRPRQVPVTNPVLLDRMRREQKRGDDEQAARRLPAHDALKVAQRGLTILPQTWEVIEQLPLRSQLCQHVHIGRIERHEFFWKVSTTGRVFNAMSGIKRELRSLIRLDGEPIGCVDIRNAQPALLANLLLADIPPQRGKGCLNIKHNQRSSIRPSPLPSSLPSPRSLSPFLDSASSGLLYEDLGRLCNLDRDRVKKRFLVDVLAKKGTYPSTVEQAFRNRFPEVWQVIQTINRESHCELIRLLQRVEAWLVIERVSPLLVDRVPIVTLHDAVFGRLQDLGTIEEAFQEALDAIGWQLARKREIPQRPGGG